MTQKPCSDLESPHDNRLEMRNNPGALALLAFKISYTNFGLNSSRSIRDTDRSAYATFPFPGNLVLHPSDCLNVVHEQAFMSYRMKNCQELYFPTIHTIRARKPQIMTKSLLADVLHSSHSEINATDYKRA